ncbi:hypothetical protein M434DRAFT_32685 [Hypoxylon sp. CO27-5]|nr:hypothetical protein M434DRAFT_32685 [Hypoxylon sp. CO27-5]
MSSGPNPLDNIPAVKAPPGETSNLINPPSKAQTVTILDAVFVSLMLIAVLIRVFVRSKLVKNWGWDDGACIIAALGSLSHTILYTQMIKIGYGRHIWDIPASWLLPTQNVQLMSSNGITYPVTVFFAKLCLLLFYLRVFGVKKAFRIIVFASVAILAAFYSAMVGVAIGSLVKCTGISQQANPFCKAYSGPIVLLNATFNVVTDFWILLLPFPLLARLNLQFRQKLSLIPVFAAGLGACAASLARMIEFATNYRSADVFWYQATNAIVVEINIAIIVACVSCFPHFYNHMKDNTPTITITITRRGLLSSDKTSRSWKGVPDDSVAALHGKQFSNGEGPNPYIELRQATSRSNLPPSR